ncbi:hypothetical protein J6590_101263 [Homalodisca vitripennis]|nr:hypothetical protein J6590_101263 [Homalodisca vitripennis]
MNSRNTKETWNVVNQYLSKKDRPNILDTIKTNFQVQEDNDIQAITEDFKESFKTSVEDIKREMVGDSFDLTEKTNLEILTKDINKALHEKQFAMAVATDLSKAFDLNRADAAYAGGGHPRATPPTYLAQNRRIADVLPKYK